jgi:hypothetical protein
MGLLIFVLAGVFMWWGLCFVINTLDKILIALASFLLVLVSSIF